MSDLRMVKCLYKYKQNASIGIILPHMFNIPFLNEAIFKWVKKHPLDDQINRLNYLATTILLLLFSAIVSAKQYIGSPLQCWIPPEFTNAYEEYAENFCFVHGTYYFSPNKSIDFDAEKRKERSYGYYQWIPVLLVAQAFFFYFPNIIWKKMTHDSEWERILTRASLLRNLSSSSKEDYKKAKKELIENLTHILQKRRDAQIFPSIACRYMLIQILYTVNIGMQFLFCAKFIAQGNIEWGWKIALSIYMQQDSDIFPRVTLCDFSVREMGNVHSHTIQCVLMVNMFNEKIYLFLWIWLIVLGLLTFGNTIWIFAILWFQKMWRIFIIRANRSSMMMMLNRDKILLLRFLKNHLPNWIYFEIMSECFNELV